MNFENRAGLFVVRYADGEALSPDRQAELLRALRGAAASAPVAIVFVVSPAVQMVDHAVPDFWMSVTTDPALRIVAIAVATPNPAVSVATRAFSTSNILKSTPVTVRPFPDEAAAVAWAAGELAAARR